MTTYLVIPSGHYGAKNIQNGSQYTSSQGYGSVIAAILAEIHGWPDWGSGDRLLIVSTMQTTDKLNIYNKIRGTWITMRFHGWLSALKALVRL